MIAVAVHTHPEDFRVVSEVLARADSEVHEVAGDDDAIETCRREKADVLLIGDAGPDDPGELLDRVKRDGDLFRVSVLMLGAELDPAEVLAWIDRGASDVLATPPAPAEVLARAFAASRMKALVHELTAQTARLEELALIDDLTGLRNRRSILQELEMLLAGARRQGRELSILMLDVDHFKPINDRHGHRAGDEVLREVSKRLRGRLRRADVAGRLGGDELLVVLPDTGAAGAETAAESMRAAVSETPVPTSAGPIQVSISLGIARWEDDEPAHALLERADRAMYAAKAGGRDSTSAA